MKPETPAEAKRWERVYDDLVKAGVCYTDAARIAYGTQHSFLGTSKGIYTNGDDTPRKLCYNCVKLMHDKKFPTKLLALKDSTGLQWFSVIPVLDEIKAPRQCEISWCSELLTNRRKDVRYCSRAHREAARRQKARL